MCMNSGQHLLRFRWLAYCTSSTVIARTRSRLTEFSLRRMSQFANRCSLGEPRLAACVRVAESFISSLAPAHGHTYVRIYSHTVRARLTGTQMNILYSENIDTHQYNHITSTGRNLLKLKVISRFNS